MSMFVRRLCLMLTLLAGGWAVVVSASDQPLPVTAYRLPAAYVAASLSGFVTTVALAVRTGRKRFAATDTPPADTGYRAGWAVGAVLLLPPLYPCAVVLADWAARGDDLSAAAEMVPPGVEPGAIGIAAAVLTLTGLLLATATPPLYRRPVEPPPTLGDPLRTVRRVLGGLVAVFVLTAALLLPVTLGDGHVPLAKPAVPANRWDADRPETVVVPGFATLQTVGVIALFAAGTAGPTILFVWRILPGRATNAVYLRSFRHDRRTWPMRKALQAALGRRFRLSGIRDPGRRVSVLDYLGWLLFVLRYSTPKFMNLEAGDDWKARLWGSLAAARCVVIDVSDLTPFVRQEIELSYHRVGLGRILFVGDGSADVAGWRERVAVALPAGAADDDIRAAVWTPDPAGRAAFAAAVRAFAASLPANPPGPADPPVGVTRRTRGLTAVPTHDAHFWLVSLLGVPTVVAVLSLLLGALSPTLAEVVGQTTSYVIWGVVGWYLLGYLIDCGSNRERVICLAFAVALLALYASLLSAVVKVRHAAERVMSSNNQKRISLGVYNYEGRHGQFPPTARPGKDGKPTLSWRVLLLPYLDEEGLFEKFKSDEPWDSPHNRKVFDENPMPRVYLRPGSTEAEAAQKRTHYQVFVGNGALFDRTQGVRLVAIQDGPSNTIMVAVAKTPVEWTKPDDLPFDPAGDPRELLRAEYGVFLIGLADGSVRAVRKEFSAENWRMAITRNGGEVVSFD